MVVGAMAASACRRACARSVAPTGAPPARRQRRLALAAAVAALAACAAPPPAFRHEGVMREVMRGGSTQARVALAEVAHPGTYAVGALAGLDGEFVVDDGAAWVAVDGPFAVRAPSRAQATLLTAAVAARFDEVPLPSPCTLLDLENTLAGLAAARGASQGPLAFVVEGRGAVQMHVVRGACPHGEPVPGKEPARVALDDVPLRAIGFFVDGQEGVVTHMGTALHMHAFATMPDGSRCLGHVDDVTFAAGAVLRVGR
jgi:hypothetical protein